MARQLNLCGKDLNLWSCWRRRMRGRARAYKVSRSWMSSWVQSDIANKINPYDNVHPAR